jgi:hypothetical protein
MAYEPEWQWFHELPSELKGIVEFLCDFVRSISTAEYAAWIGFFTLEVILLVLVFKLILKRPKE